jgi:hypothetical protein
LFCLVRAVVLSVMTAGFVMMLFGVAGVTVRGVGVVGGLLVMAGFVVLGSFAVMLGGVLMMLGSLVMVIDGMFRHVSLPVQRSEVRTV